MVLEAYNHLTSPAGSLSPRGTSGERTKERGSFHASAEGPVNAHKHADCWIIGSLDY